MAAGDITDELLVALGRKLDDAGTAGNYLDGFKFDINTKLDALNKAQIEFVNMIDPVYLTELGVKDPGVDMSTGWKDIELLSLASVIGSGCTGCNQYANGSIVLNGAKGILNLWVTPAGVAANAKWAERIEFDQVKQYSRGLRKFSDTNVLYYIFGRKIYLLVTTLAATVADIYWLRIPCEITQDVDPMINSSFHQIMLDLATVHCWPKEGEYETRRADAWTRAFEQIKLLNEKAKVR
jgi:hypothetical protein